MSWSAGLANRRAYTRYICELLWMRSADLRIQTQGDVRVGRSVCSRRTAALAVRGEDAVT
jgi:hypothetical protein